MAIDTHIARIGLVQVASDGTVFDKDSATFNNFLDKTSRPPSPKLEWSTEHRVLADSVIPNSSNNPTIDDYVLAEAADDFALSYMDQFIIITQVDPNTAGSTETTDSGTSFDTVLFDFSGDANAADIQVSATPAVGQNRVIDDLYISSDVDATLTFKDGSGGATMFTIEVSAGLPLPITTRGKLFVPTNGNAMFIASSAAGTQQGFTLSHDEDL